MNRTAPSQALPAGLGIVAVVAIIGYSVLHFFAAGRDDTFILLWAGQSLGQGPWFVNFNFAAQEISSSIIGVFIAALTKGQPVGHALLIIKLLGLMSAVAMRYLVWLKRSEIFHNEVGKNWFSLVVLVATAASPVFMYWSFGGLETPHHALLLLAFFILFVGSVRKQQLDSIDWPLLAVGCLLVAENPVAAYSFATALILP